MDNKVNTISREITVTGTGLHTGDEVTTVLRPREDPGVFFVREDLVEWENPDSDDAKDAIKEV